MSNNSHNSQRLHGRTLLDNPSFNKGTNFSRAERSSNGLLGMLPFGEESLDCRVERAYQAFHQKGSRLQQHIYLRQIQDFDENLFVQLISEYPTEMLPVIYTPTVGQACQQFSDIFIRPRGLFLNYPEKDHIEEILDNVSMDSVEVIVITDGEAILGIGDQGVGGMGIPIGKLSLYSAMGGINPSTSLPVVLDVGTNNEDLLNDRFYLGWKHERIRGQQYDDFVELVLMAIHKRWPNAVIQFEDFGSENAQRLLDKYLHRICCFNDDIQGTSAVTLGCLLSACRISGKPIEQCKVVIAGAGAAGGGIAHGIVAGMCDRGLDVAVANRQIYMLNSEGLIHTESTRSRPYQLPYAREQHELENWVGDYKLLDTVRNVQPDVLIGVTGQGGFFTKEIILEMASHTERPCIFPLSNPTSRIEATPTELIRWTDGRAIVATGSPFDPVPYKGVLHEIAQCNNAYAFPGIGLGLIAAQSRRATPEMFTATSKVIGNAVPDLSAPGKSLLPSLNNVRPLSRKIAIAVAEIAFEQEIAAVNSGKNVEQLVDDKMWCPNDPYRLN